MEQTGQDGIRSHHPEPRRPRGTNAKLLAAPHLLTTTGAAGATVSGTATRGELLAPDDSDMPPVSVVMPMLLTGAGSSGIG